jgi:hypothetical protein
MMSRLAVVMDCRFVAALALALAIAPVDSRAAVVPAPGAVAFESLCADFAAGAPEAGVLAAADSFRTPAQPVDVVDSTAIRAAGASDSEQTPAHLKHSVFDEPGHDGGAVGFLMLLALPAGISTKSGYYYGGAWLALAPFYGKSMMETESLPVALPLNRSALGDGRSATCD